ncbi:hypothetical protein [Alkalicoccus daliensis]|uniref:Uncharacterized protein n=1 Tax=Alkalicoccus daliensis TaxID=745820 RepID=A0A1H0F6M7_9BACI|nr:hypothetical protein [Alkalicoccus daliensis]SDN90255.1 hypothetical protein SAMN04488053_104210 [Alkalicoccus daliensis]
MRNFWETFIILFLFYAGSAQGLFSQYRMYGADITDQPSRFSEGFHYLLFCILIGMMIMKIKHERKVKKEMKEENLN